MPWSPVGNLRGPAGPGGAAATVAAGTTVTGAPGTASVVANSGTTTAAVFDFTVPRGSQWFTGTAAPVAQTGELPGDLYLDTVSGDYYRFS